MILGLARTLLLWAHIVLFMAHSLLGRLFIRERSRRLRFTSRSMAWHARITTWYLGLRVTVKGVEHIPDDHRVLLVGNHMGYMDIVAVSSVLPTLFITSTDVQKAFFMGFMARMAGSLFVNRRSKSRLPVEIAQIRETISGGSAVVLFPEGTSSNGDGVLPFKAALFAVAQGAGLAVSPMCLRYQRIGGRPITPANRDRLYYYGDIRFLPHILGIPFLGSVDLLLEFLPPIPHDADRSRKEVAADCQAAISAAYAANE